MAGYRELLAVEWDNNAVETFRLNFPDVPIFHGDIVKLSVEEVLERTGLQSGELDVLEGSPPCQGFSTAGKRDLYDDRNQLFREYVRLLRGLRPKVFVMENVSGMVKGKMKLIFAEILRELKASGYHVSARLMNAMYFHVPQSRERLIFIGVREDLGIAPSHPRGRGPVVSFRQAVDGLPDNLFAPENRGEVPKYIALLKPGQSIGDIAGKYFGWVKVHPDRPAPTLPKTTTYAGFCQLFHPYLGRCLATEEQKRICSYPDAFQFAGEFKDGVERMGNSVPPLFMRSVADHIRTNILDSDSLVCERVEG
jgi:DNA (cytosine-5)-methyltransferase 1